MPSERRMSSINDWFGMCRMIARWGWGSGRFIQDMAFGWASRDRRKRFRAVAELVMSCCLREENFASHHWLRWML